MWLEKGGLCQIGDTLYVWPLMHVTLVPAFFIYLNILKICRVLLFITQVAIHLSLTPA